jgi:NAD(P)-dependent dehydrogenase (short-subunit alcohol dehydrogenase family)
MAGILEGKAALVTGAARGIGRAVAETMAREGARVLVSDLDAASLADTVAAINAKGGQVVSLAGDVTRAADVEAMTKAAVAAFGRLDCAFNNAGVAPYQVGAAGKTTHEWSEEAFDRMVEINLKGVWLAMKSQITQMLAQGSGGAIVNTASIAGLLGLQTASGYVAAKHGVVGLTKTAAMEYAKRGIRVNSVCPGYIETDMTKDTMARRGEQVLSRVPFGRMGTAQEIAEMVVWLCSERASFVSGANYNVDGGYVAS